MGHKTGGLGAIILGFVPQIFEDFRVRRRFPSQRFGCNGRNGDGTTHMEAYCCSRILLLFCCSCSTLKTLFIAQRYHALPSILGSCINT